MLRIRTDYIHTDIKEPHPKRHKPNNDEITSALTQKILSCDWCSPEEFEELPEKDSDETIPQGQGGIILCKETVKTMPHNMDALSPAMLRRYKSINPKTYFTLWSKRIGHTLSLEGYVDRLNTYLTCFNETFVLPMFCSSFNHFAEQNKTLIPSEMHKDILSILQNALWHQNCSNEKIQATIKEIHDPFQVLPVQVGSGNNYHSIQVIFYKKHFIYCNRGDGCGEYPGWRLFKIHNMEAITEEWIKKLTDRQIQTEANYRILKKIISDLKAEEIFHYAMKDQSAGNCVLTSYRASFSALLTLWKMDDGFSENTQILPHGDFHVLSLQANKYYKPARNMEYQLVLKDLLLNINDILRREYHENNVSLDTAVIRQVSQYVYAKLSNHPELIFKIGPNLWLDLILSCEKLILSKQTMDIRIINFANYLINFEYANNWDISIKGPKADHLIKLGCIFFTKQKQHIWPETSILKLLNNKNLIAITLNKSKIINLSSHEIQKVIYKNLSHIDFNDKNLFIPKFCKYLTSVGEYQSTENLASLISNIDKQGTVYEKLSTALSKNSLFEEAERVTGLIFNVWMRSFAYFRISEAFRSNNLIQESERIERILVLTLCNSLAFKHFSNEAKNENPIELNISKHFSKFLKYPNFIAKLVELIAHQGYIREASSLLYSLPEPKKSNTEARLVNILILTNNLESAREIAIGIDDRKLKTICLLKVLSSYVFYQDFIEAEQMTLDLNHPLTLTNWSTQSSSLIKLVNLCITHNCFTEAESIALTITNSRLKSKALKLICKVLYEKNNLAEAKRIEANI